MADVTEISVDPRPLPTTDYDSGLSVPPFDTDFFSQGYNQNDAAMGDLDLDFSFDDLYIPSADELDDLLNPIKVQGSGSQFGLLPFVDQVVSNSNSSESLHASRDRSSNGSGSMNSDSQQISGYINVPSPESNGLNRETSDNCEKVSNWPSPESRGSRNCEPNVSDDSNNGATWPVGSFRNSNNTPVRNRVVNKVKLEDPSKSKGNSSLLKRKKDSEDFPNNKCRKSNSSSDNSNNNNNSGELSAEDEKKKARLVRNRESAQLSRQRKKHYVEELEEKVKTMHSTIQDLNVKISYFMAENATLRQQMGCGTAGPPPSMAPPPPGMYPHPAMMYPCMPYAPPYMMKQGSKVPLVPIPRLKPQQPTQAPEVSKKKPKIKKVAGVSFLGLLFFVMLFGGLVPMVNVRYGGVRETVTGGLFYEKHHGRVLMVNGTGYGNGRGFSSKSSVHCDQKGHDNVGKPNPDEFVGLCNGSEPLVASLYVPRNDKLVKIDGNLIIHSVLASEKAIPSHGNGVGGDTGLAVPGNLVPNTVPSVRIDGVRHPQLKALLGSGLADEVGKNPKATDGRLQKWFQEGLAGPMLSSGVCTKVFQFDVSTASTSGAIVSATTPRNISEELTRNATRPGRSRNRRFLRGLPTPLPVSSRNISRRDPQKDNLNGTVSPMVVSVLVDPREVGDAEVDGVMGAKSISRIFVVVLTDSVKYATYSCVLPFKGHAPHLVTT